MTTRRFELHRDVDVTGVSGTGVVAEGCHFVEPDICVLRWTSQTPTSVVFHEKGLASVEQVHGHGGSTRIVWLDRPGPEGEVCIFGPVGHVWEVLRTGAIVCHDCGARRG